VATRIEGERLSAIVDLAFIYPEFALFTKRAHDRNMPTRLIGAFFAISAFIDFLVIVGLGGANKASTPMLVVMVPWTIFALALLVELGMRRGTSGPNRYGPDPLAGRV